MRRRLYLLGATLTLAIGLVSAATVLGSSAAAQDEQAMDVVLREWSIDPRQMVVTAGRPVRFNLSNAGQTNSHTFTIQGQFEEWTSDSLQPGEATTWVTTFDKPGVYQIWCPQGTNNSHRDRGMVGTFTVVAPDAPRVINVPVDLGDFYFDPNTPSLVPAQTVRFHLRNVGTSQHEMLIKGLGGEMRSGAVDPGAQREWDVTFATGGTYEVYCPMFPGTEFEHRQQGMVGYIQVTGS
jgi:uncharacterized cupredoxin-like copper-binding protein